MITMLDVSFNGISKIRLDFICLVMIILVALAARIPQEENRLKKLIEQFSNDCRK